MTTLLVGAGIGVMSNVVSFVVVAGLAVVLSFDTVVGLTVVLLVLIGLNNVEVGEDVEAVLLILEEAPLLAAGVPERAGLEERKLVGTFVTVGLARVDGPGHESLDMCVFVVSAISQPV